MEVHKPKPVHNWREFLMEIGTITVGVLIALGAEQAVEWLHWQDKAAYATEQIQRELSDGMYYSVERVMVRDCIQNRLDELETKLLSSEGQWSPVAPAGTVGLQAGNVVAQPYRPWNSIAWTAAVADTSVTHFSRERLAHYARIYGLMDRMRSLNQEEYDAVARLNVLSKPVALTSDKKIDLLEAIESERSINRIMGQVAGGDAYAWNSIGLDPVQAQVRVMKNSTTYAACQATRRWTTLRWKPGK